MIAKPLIQQSSLGWILNSMDESSYPNITIKLPLMDNDDDSSSSSGKTCQRSSSSSSSFTWSDFPCYGDDNDDDMISSTVSLSSLPFTRPTSAFEIGQVQQSSRPSTTTSMSMDDKVTSSSKSTFELRDYIPRARPPSSPTSCCDVLSIQGSVDAIPLSTSLSSITINKMKKRVSFAPLVRVRTHTIVLGDHPLCSGGMALQLGWESSKTQYIPLHTSRGRCSWTMRSTNNIAKRSLAQLRLNYQQRRQRLMELTGYTSSQLLHQEYLLVCCGSGTDQYPTTNAIVGDV